MDLVDARASSARRVLARIERTSAAQRGALALACIVLLSLAFRLHLSANSSLWIDELLTRRDIRAPWPRLLQRPSVDQPMLMFVLVRLATDLLGTGETGLRAVSLLFGCVLLVAVYELCRELGLSVARSLIVVATFALTPFFIAHATEARMYALLISCTTLATTRALRVLRGQQLPRNVIGFGLVAAAAAATQYFGLAYAFALLGVVVIGAAMRWKTVSVPGRIVVVAALLVTLVPLGYLTHRAVEVARFYAVGSSGTSTGSAINWDLARELRLDFAFLTREGWGAVIEPGLVVVGLILLTLRLRGVARTLPIGLGLLPSAFALFLSSGAHFVAARYLSPSIVFYHLAACTTLFAAVDGIRRKLPVALVPVTAAAVLIGLLSVRVAEYPKGYGLGGEDYRGFQRYFMANLAADTALVTHPGHFGDVIFGREYKVGPPPISLEKFRPRRRFNRYVIVEIHSTEERQAEVASLVERTFGLSPEAWASVPFLPLQRTTYQPAVRARLVQLPDDYVPPSAPAKKRRRRKGHP